MLVFCMCWKVSPYEALDPSAPLHYRVQMDTYALPPSLLLMSTQSMSNPHGQQEVWLKIQLAKENLMPSPYVFAKRLLTVQVKDVGSQLIGQKEIRPFPCVSRGNALP